MSELISVSESLAFFKYPAVNSCTITWMELSRKFHIVYGGFLHNHMTHNLAVIGSLGLSEEEANEKLQWWYELYCNKQSDSAGLELRDSYESKATLAIDNSNWKDHVLPNDANDVVYYSYLRYFEARIKEFGHELVVREHLPFLVTGLAGSAVHPIIHLGFGLEVKSDMMIAEGLACMCIYFLNLGSAAPTSLTDITCDENLVVASDATSLLQASIDFIGKAQASGYHATSVRAMDTTYSSLPVSGFQRRVRAFTDVNYLAGVFDAHLPLQVSTVFEAVKQATALIACAYLASDNEFFVIHGLTSLHGLLVSLHYLSEPAQKNALVCWWKTTMAVLVVQSVITEDKMRCALLEQLQQWQQAEASTPADRLTAEETVENEAWWWRTLSVSVTSTEEHASKGCYVLYRWSQYSDMPAHSLRLFRAVAANQIKGCPEEGNPRKNIWFSS